MTSSRTKTPGGAPLSSGRTGLPPSVLPAALRALVLSLAVLALLSTAVPSVHRLVLPPASCLSSSPSRPPRPPLSDAGIASAPLSAPAAPVPPPAAALWTRPASAVAAAVVMLVDVGAFASRALVLMTAKPAAPSAASSAASSASSAAPSATGSAQYAAYAASAAATLQKQWYHAADGLWAGTGWWNCANLLTTLGDFALAGAGADDQRTIAAVMLNTFGKAQQVAQTASKAVDAASGLVQSSYERLDRRDAGDDASGFAGFINTYYDDEGWWALAWIRAFDVTGDAAYLAMAEAIFADMQTGAAPAACGGGIWWSKDRKYKNAIANELFLAVAAALALRSPDAAARANYTATATAQWAWFRGSGLLNAAGTINDGLTINDDGSCVNNNGTVWSYNQGVVLGGLVSLYHAQAAGGGSSADAALIPAAAAIAHAAIGALSTDGILHESCEANNGSCGGDGPMFKGVFLRNLHYLQQDPALPAADATAFQAYILQNADAIWASDRDAATNQLGLVWSGPPNAGGGPTPSTHGAAMDCLVAAVAAA